MIKCILDIQADCTNQTPFIPCLLMPLKQFQQSSEAQLCTKLASTPPRHLATKAASMNLLSASATFTWMQFATSALKLLSEAAVTFAVGTKGEVTIPAGSAAYSSLSCLRAVGGTVWSQQLVTAHFI